MTDRRHIQLGTASLALGGAAFGLIQILQGMIGQFNPRPVVSVLLAVGVALAGWTLGRGRQRTARSQRLSGLLREWPLRRLSDCNDLELGVFPARPLTGEHARAGEGLQPPYVPRELDQPLRKALTGGGMVLVIGPERSGKSRTILEAARTVAGDRPVVVPVDGAALSDLTGEDASELDPEAVWWLDDLERYLDQVRGAELSVLLDTGLTVAATLREDRWRQLLQAGGDDGERGRRLRGSAQVFELPAELSASEAEAAPELLGGLDLGRGLGVALSAPATGEVVPQPSGRPAPRQRADPVMALAGALTLAVAGALSLVILADGFSRAAAPPLGAQVDAIRQRAAAAHKVVTFARSEYLHGFDQQSYVVMLRPTAQGSDELRVYDVIDGYLRLRLDFQPRTTVRGFGANVFVVGQDRQSHTGLFDYGLENVRIVDLVGDGKQELVADYSPYNSPVVYKLPVIGYWDDVAQQYRLAPLLTQPPTRPLGYRTDPSFDSHYLLRDLTPARTLRAWATGGYWLTPAKGSTNARLTIVDDVTSRRGDTDQLVDGYDMIPSASGVNVTEAGCGESVVTNQSLDQTQIARIASGLAGPAQSALKPAPGSVETCVR